MVIEIASIFVATVYQFALWDLRYIFDLGFTDKQTPVLKAVLLCLVQVAWEAVIDVAWRGRSRPRRYPIPSKDTELSCFLSDTLQSLLPSL